MTNGSPISYFFVPCVNQEFSISTLGFSADCKLPMGYSEQTETPASTTVKKWGHWALILGMTCNLLFPFRHGAIIFGAIYFNEKRFFLRLYLMVDNPMNFLRFHCKYYVYITAIWTKLLQIFTELFYKIKSILKAEIYVNAKSDDGAIGLIRQRKI